jgi:predicted DNA-binding transcriptional regulator AlpA
VSLYSHKKKPGRLLEVGDLASILSTKPGLVKALVESGDLPPPIRFGRLQRWRECDVRRFIRAKALIGSVKFSPRPLSDVPSDLADVQPSLLEYDRGQFSSAVYFLVKDDRVVYVGKALNVAVRVEQHARGTNGTPKKEFDRVLYLPVDPERLSSAEAYFIRLLKPVLNGAGDLEMAPPAQ